MGSPKWRELKPAQSKLVYTGRGKLCPVLAAVLLLLAPVLWLQFRSRPPAPASGFPCRMSGWQSMARPSRKSGIPG